MPIHFGNEGAFLCFFMKGFLKCKAQRTEPSPTVSTSEENKSEFEE